MSTPKDAVAAAARNGFHCQVEGYHHGYGNLAKRGATLHVESLCASADKLDERARRTLLSQLSSIAVWQLRYIQSRECAAKLVEGKTGIPSVLYKYIPMELIERGVPRSLRATQPSALNDVMECSISPMGETGASASSYRTAVGAKLQECLGITLSDGELAKLWVTTGDMELSGFIREHLNSRVGVVSLSSNALVPTMWAHYAQNTGVVVGYDTEVLAKLGFDLRSVVYLDIPPMWQPTRGDLIEAAFADRESMDRAAAAGKVVLGHHILCSVGLTTMSSDWRALARLLFVKGMSWAYEQEVRLLVDQRQTLDTGKLDKRDQPIRVVGVPSEAIKEIYRGPHTSEEDVALVVEKARGENKKGLYVRSTSFRNFSIQNTGGSRY